MSRSGGGVAILMRDLGSVACLGRGKWGGVSVFVARVVEWSSGFFRGSGGGVAVFRRGSGAGAFAGGVSGRLVSWIYDKKRQNRIQ